MVTSSTNHRDVNVVEVEELLVHLGAAGKKFESKIYTHAPGGHSFDRIDTSFARNVRKEMYAFPEKHLKQASAPGPPGHFLSLYFASECWPSGSYRTRPAAAAEEP